jgi:hypothetical protein
VLSSQSGRKKNNIRRELQNLKKLNNIMTNQIFKGISLHEILRMVHGPIIIKNVKKYHHVVFD